ncbi:hypothetical protein BSL82_03395 [Tardibacter chloracetimidivorans]|uniref:Uncharacterized protein n=1 Tax=Tardibacter chloracetimidivorans TaxID=1921510 RepID=A0A1L3ZS58_9SPHN|nr:hypothetical protein BSL82_03395 [Tardibacter chloracetimidivorans]
MFFVWFLRCDLRFFLSFSISSFGCLGGRFVASSRDCRMKSVSCSGFLLVVDPFGLPLGFGTGFGHHFGLFFDPFGLPRFRVINSTGASGFSIKAPIYSVFDRCDDVGTPRECWVKQFAQFSDYLLLFVI